MITEVERNSLGIVALQKIRWKEVGCIDISNMTILFSGGVMKEDNSELVLRYLRI